MRGLDGNDRLVAAPHHTFDHQITQYGDGGDDILEISYVGCGGEGQDTLESRQNGAVGYGGGGR